ncbi:M56 family metallopeptidase [Actinoallomurus purpureus]|uniref:M56 family metallopeptidase n=1 Tax=Actinoallomurus purpureus TaxID=478114 RepID=UPI002092D409|nr:M56 family metallopeptidase [Actinoallomurus purpureus]MCO6006139.1 M56 family metallopeptidase [Actinoallomurus purpureus]
MSPLAELGAITLALGVGAGPLLSRSAWCQRIPRVAALAWLGALAGTLAGLVGVVALVSTGRHGLAHRAAEWAANCWHHHDGSGAPAAYAFNGALLLSAIAATYVAVTRYRRTVAQRRRHQEALQFVVRLPGDIDDVCVLDHPLPVAYCVPSRKRPIVVSSGALDQLDDVQLQAVLAHERAHLRYRHHLFLTTVDALAAALFWLPTFREGRRCLPILLEMAADDVAARRCGRGTVAVALRKLAIAPSPLGGLAAHSARRSEIDRRLARLETPTAIADNGRLRRLTLVMAVTSVALPALISAGWLAEMPFFC